MHKCKFILPVLLNNVKKVLVGTEDFHIVLVSPSSHAAPMHYDIISQLSPFSSISFLDGKMFVAHGNGVSCYTIKQGNLLELTETLPIGDSQVRN